jgi:hypothetical protein
LLVVGCWLLVVGCWLERILTGLFPVRDKWRIEKREPTTNNQQP